MNHHQQQAFSSNGLSQYHMENLRGRAAALSFRPLAGEKGRSKFFGGDERNPTF
jgi:hypothetical protein